MGQGRTCICKLKALQRFLFNSSSNVSLIFYSCERYEVEMCIGCDLHLKNGLKSTENNYVNWKTILVEGNSNVRLIVPFARNSVEMCSTLTFRTGQGQTVNTTNESKLYSFLSVRYSNVFNRPNGVQRCYPRRSYTCAWVRLPRNVRLCSANKWLELEPNLFASICTLTRYVACQFLSKSSTFLTFIFKVKYSNRAHWEVDTWLSRAMWDI